MVSIRPLARDDSLAAVTQLLHRAYARLGASGLNFTAVNQSEAVTANRIHGGHCLVAKWSGMLVGTVLAKPTDQTSECEYFRRTGVATLNQFAVDPGHQGRRIGRALIDASEEWALSNGHCELALDTAEPARHLVELYLTRGFVLVGHVQWPGKTYRSIVMSKSLRAA